MKKVSIIFLYLMFAILSFASQEAESHQESKWGIPLIIFQFVNLILVVIIFYFLLKVRLPAFFKLRLSEIQKQIIDANEQKARAEKELTEINLRIQNLDKEIEKIKKEAIMVAEKEKNLIMKKAEEFANILKNEAEEELKRKELEIKRKIKEYVVNEAIENAKKIIIKNFSETDKENILKDFLEELKEERND